MVKNDDQSKAVGSYHQFLASAKAVKLAHQINPDMKCRNDDCLYSLLCFNM